MQNAKPDIKFYVKPKASAAAHTTTRRGRTFLMDKLMRNTAVACAALLMLLALGNVNRPWAQATTAQLRRVLTMRIDLDESLGRLTFVQNLVPESAQVFWQMGGDSLMLPTTGRVAHAYSKDQPWVEFACSEQQRVSAAKDGTVAAVMQNDAGDWTVLIDHDDAAQTVYAYMAQALIEAGQPVVAGDIIGVTADAADARLYFELRHEGVPKDPAMGVQ